MYSNTTGRVRAYDELSSESITPSDVRHGCPLSPFLFNFIVNVLLEITLSLSKYTGVELLPGDSLVDLEYADDIVLFGEDADKMQSSDHSKQQCKYVRHTILSLEMQNVASGLGCIDTRTNDKE
ncbi:unnamed protein product [Schistosoma margrebowiei]|uniref:Uncharacterized protein n=1 Tax=Schistosoma margrebowiei TaxID=48269 RepID=A0A183N6L2_9TREM|nr:unnamed protein product [Schistosoma margrebowiei]